MPPHGPEESIFKTCQSTTELPEAGAVCHGVVDPPEPGGDVVRQHYIYGVVTSPKEQHHHSRHREPKREPVQEEEPSGAVYDSIACGSYDVSITYSL